MARKYLKSMSWTDEEIDRVIEAELMEPDLHTNKLKVKDFLKKPMAIVLFCYMHEPTGNSSKAVKMPMNTLGELIAAFISRASTLVLFMQWFLCFHKSKAIMMAKSLSLLITLSKFLPLISSFPRQKAIISDG